MPPGVARVDVEIRTDDPIAPAIVVPVTVAIASGPHLSTGAMRAAAMASFPYSPLTTLHDLAARATPSGPAAMEVVATNRTSFSPYSIQLNAEGRFVAGMLPFPASCRDGLASGEIARDTLEALVADGRVVVQVVDPTYTFPWPGRPEPGRHLVRLRYPVTDLSHDFGPVAGDARTVALRLRNRGTRPSAMRA